MEICHKDSVKALIDSIVPLLYRKEEMKHKLTDGHQYQYIPIIVQVWAMQLLLV